MSVDFPSELPKGKYNKWCERRFLVCNNERLIAKANSHAHNPNLTQNERAALFLHDLVSCQGIEFVVFSSARFKNPVKLPRNVLIVPCFLPELEGQDVRAPLTRLTFRMMEHSRYIYDGWIPISDWNLESVRSAIRTIDESLTLFGLRDIWYTWEPKYILPSPLAPSSQNIEARHIQEILDLQHSITSWMEKDAWTFYRSLAWFSQSRILPQPAARFLYCMVAIESLAEYIERGAPNDSIFSSLKAFPGLSREQKEKCIEVVFKQHANNPIHAVQSAYFECVISIKKMLESHLKQVFGDNSEPVNLFFKIKVHNKTLYDIRHDIAHGGMDVIDDLQRQRIADRITDIERVTKQYLIKVLTMVLQKYPLEQKMTHSMPAIITHVSHEGMYQGPTHMAEYYTYFSR